MGTGPQATPDLTLLYPGSPGPREGRRGGPKSGSRSGTTTETRGNGPTPHTTTLTTSDSGSRIIGEVPHCSQTLTGTTLEGVDLGLLSPTRTWVRHKNWGETRRPRKSGLRYLRDSTRGTVSPGLWRVSSHCRSPQCIWTELRADVDGEVPPRFVPRRLSFTPVRDSPTRRTDSTTDRRDQYVSEPPWYLSRVSTEPEDLGHRRPQTRPPPSKPPVDLDSWTCDRHPSTSRPVPRVCGKRVCPRREAVGVTQMTKGPFPAT